MSILIPVVGTGITLNEVPGHLAFYVEIGECNQRCHGCHSPHLWKHVLHKTSLEDLLRKILDAKEEGADAVVLMGGTTNGLTEGSLKAIIQAISCVLPVALYSGSDNIGEDMKYLTKTDLTWLKTGSYKEKLGGLRDPKTNQRFLEKQPNGKIKDITEVFHAKSI